MYYLDLQIVFLDAIQNEATNQILLVLPILTHIIYRKRRILRAEISVEQSNWSRTSQHFTTLIGALSCTAATVSYWYGSYTFTPLEYHILTLPILTAGLVLVLFNLETLRQLIFPIFFLFFLTPIPEELLFKLSSVLSTSSSLVSSAVANLLGVARALRRNEESTYESA